MYSIEYVNIAFVCYLWVILYSVYTIHSLLCTIYLYMLYVGAFELPQLWRCEYSCGRRAAVRLLQAQGQEATDAAVYLNCGGVSIAVVGVLLFAYSKHRDKRRQMQPST